MSLIVDVASDGVRTPLGRERIRDIALAVLDAERVHDALLSVALVSRRHIARLNHAHLGHSGPTDVIAFGLRAPAGRRRTRRRPPPVIGDIYIAPEVARANAQRFDRGVREEMTRLVVHGTLHVLGFDHPDGDARVESPMWRRQEQLVSQLLGDTSAGAHSRRRTRR